MYHQSRMKKRMIKFDTIKLSSTDQGGVQEKKSRNQVVPGTKIGRKMFKNTRKDRRADAQEKYF